MSVFKKLQSARTIFLDAPVKKSGKNKFAGYEYFELGDFIPAINRIFNEVGLCGVVRFGDIATLTIYDTDGTGEVMFTSPMVFAENTKGQAIQNLGSTHTYLRRYLWLMAMEIVEHDSVDASPQEEIRKPVETKKPVDAKKSVEDKPTGATKEQELFVSKLIEWAALQDSTEELVGSWKANQSQIDAIKKDDPTLYEHLKTCFTELKSNLKA